MLWSLIKILVFIAAIAALAFGADYLMGTEGGVQVTVSGTEYTLGPLQSVIAALVLIFLVWLALKLLSLLVAVVKFLNGDETAISRYFDRNREQRGYQALSEGLTALASGEGTLAMSKAAKAEKYLKKPELTNLLTAQAAEMTGDTRKATETYKLLIGDQGTRFVGVRGIMKQKLAEGDNETARKLAEKAFELKPRHEETQDVLLGLQAQARDWAGARGTLSAKLKSGSLPRDVYYRREAVLALSEAQDVLAEGSTVESQEQAIEANRKSPDLVPAAAMAARSYIAKGKPKNAVRILKKAWEAQPHPDLAAAFAGIELEETPDERVKRFTALTRIHPDDPETRLLLAELNIVAEDFPEARRALGDLALTAADARALTLMAAIERGEGAPDTVIKGWLAKALTAPRGPQWVCDKCHHIHSEWGPVCVSCEGFDTLTWRAPQAPENSSSAGENMLPLIVGELEDKSKPDEAHAFAEAEVLSMDDPGADDLASAENDVSPDEQAEPVEDQKEDDPTIDQKSSQ